MFTLRNIRFIVLASSVLLVACEQTDVETLNNSEDVSLESLGEKIYFDTNLSSPAGQSCASCHLPEAGFADPDDHFPVSEGVISGRFGNRNAPTASYAALIPEFNFNADTNQFEGGQFWDGRASTLEDQAQGPFVNVLEMNNTQQGVIDSIRKSDYAEDFKTVFGENSLDDVATAYVQVSQAIAAFERTSLFLPFTSKFDAVRNGDDVFTIAEQRGMNIFNGKARCNVCHSIQDEQPVFTNFSYHNLGVQANPDNPFYNLDSSLNPDGTSFVDLGLGGVLNDTNENGKFRVPTLRNITDTAPYMHNGVFNTLREVLDFYNTRDINPLQPAAEVSANKNNRIGNLGLTDDEIEDLIAFLETLSDGYMR